MVDPDEQEIKQTLETTANIPMNTTVTGNFVTLTIDLTPKTYLAILQVSSDTITQSKTLDSTTFEVKPGIEITKTIPDVTNLLIWVNDRCEEHKCDKDNECDKDNNEGRLRLDLLEGILKQSSISYHIVYDREDFQTELRNPYYTDFLILGNHHSLQDDYWKELREQVYAGKGFLSSLYPKQQEHHKEDYNPLLGIRYDGHLSGDEYEVELVDSPISEAGTFNVKGEATKVEAMEGTIVAGWVKETECCYKGKESEYPAIVLNEYGNGRTIYYAFDLGLTLNDENYDQLSDLINNSINYVHKPVDTITFYPYQLIPVDITIKSLGAAFDLRITETYPAETKLYDPSTKQWIT